MTRKVLKGNVLQNQMRATMSSAIDIGNGFKECQECGAMFNSTDVHSCVNYLQRLIRTIVGDTAFERAQHVIETNNGKDIIQPSVNLGTLEELMQDSFTSFTTKFERKFE